MTAAETSPVAHLMSNHNRCCAMKEIIEIIARAIFDEPDVVSVTEISGMHTSILELKVAKAESGKVIGKQGRTAEALRTILRVVSAKAKKRTVLEIMNKPKKVGMPER
jgi:predicted RNA-binding protein YlqC (UPF0109 family)